MGGAAPPRPSSIAGLDEVGRVGGGGGGRGGGGGQARPPSPDRRGCDVTETLTLPIK